MSATKISPADHAEITRLIARGQEASRAPERTQLASTAAHWLSRVADQVRIYPVVNVEFTDADACRRFHALGTTVITKFDRFADLFLADLTVLDQLILDPALVWVEHAGSASAPPPRIGEGLRSRAAAESIIRNGLGKELRGKGVIIAIIDSGLDFRNPDFITYDTKGQPESRLLYFWDTLGFPYEENPGKVPENAPPVRYPSGAPIGRISTQEELTAELRSPRPALQVWDTHGHGTACAGIAAGNGNSSRGRYAGVAPEASLIAVRIGEGPSLENAYLLNCICGWLDEKAGNRPLVLSCSFGGQAGGHDGFRVEERQLDARFPPDKKGRILCVAAGNEGQASTHASIRLGPAARTTELSWGATDVATLSIFFDTDRTDDLKVTLPGTAESQVQDYFHRITRQVVWVINLGAGPGQLTIESPKGREVSAEAYLASSRGAASFDTKSARFDHLVATPGTCRNAITVGSYNFNETFDIFGRELALGDQFRPGAALVIGALSSYSSPGPLRGGAIKPDVAAPGQFFTASAPMNVKVLLRDSTGRYQVFNGTSAATPYTAGIIALLLQKKPDLTTGEIKELIRENSTWRGDNFVGNAPNPAWGSGKLDQRAVRAMIKALD
ncbi:MAG TPA: S8 family serine peptidase [Isosphaeraceae bacterium]|nr:S8 family serine peptidase [Isosphaeraceae bacterium]